MMRYWKRNVRLFATLRWRLLKELMWEDFQLSFATFLDKLLVHRDFNHHAELTIYVGSWDERSFHILTRYVPREGEWMDFTWQGQRVSGEVTQVTWSFEDDDRTYVNLLLVSETAVEFHSAIDRLKRQA